MVKNLGWEDPLEEGMATLLYSCLENPHGQRSLAGYSPWGHKELDRTERLSTAQHRRTKGLSWWLSGKEPACDAGAKGDIGLIAWLGRSPGGRHGNPLLYSCLEKPMDRGDLVGYSPWGRKELYVTEQQKNNNKENRGKQSVRVMLGRNQQNLTVWVGGRDGETDLRLWCLGI